MSFCHTSVNFYISAGFITYALVYFSTSRLTIISNNKFKISICSFLVFSQLGIEMRQYPWLSTAFIN